MGAIIGSMIPIWGFYIVLALIFKHKVGLIIDVILFLILSIMVVIYAGNWAMLISTLVFIPCIVFIPNYKLEMIIKITMLKTKKNNKCSILLSRAPPIIKASLKLVFFYAEKI